MHKHLPALCLEGSPARFAAEGLLSVTPSKSDRSAVKLVGVLWVSSCIAEDEAPHRCSGWKSFWLCWLWYVTSVEALHPVILHG